MYQIPVLSLNVTSNCICYRGMVCFQGLYAGSVVGKGGSYRAAIFPCRWLLVVQNVQVVMLLKEVISETKILRKSRERNQNVKLLFSRFCDTIRVETKPITYPECVQTGDRSLYSIEVAHNLEGLLCTTIQHWCLCRLEK